ncbi:hypothetical protein EZS27_017296 [termite gut metagenome]|uniref:Uncharacterized protein n=1 Tax=termite gut metagenome TaxID=433724 RepID=A0A5J4RLW5_9ZZZZ
MLDMLKRLSIQTEASQLRKILQDNWKLEPHLPTDTKPLSDIMK